MAGMSSVRMDSSAHIRGQSAAIAGLRYRLFVNSLRTARGQVELISRIVIGLAFALGGLGGAFGLGAAAWLFVSEGRVAGLALLLWPMFMFWQFFPIMSTAFTENVDSSSLLRFPLDYSTYFVLRLVYGALDPVTTLGGLWLLGITIGIGVASPGLAAWAVVALLGFAVFNLALVQVIFVWVERWLAQRRTREIMGIVFFLALLGFQLVGPLMNRYGRQSAPGVARLAQELSPWQRVLPPGLAADALAHASRRQFAAGVGSCAAVWLYGIAVLALLHLRLRAQYRGENLSEAAARTVSPAERQALPLGWNVPGLSGPLAALIEKEFRYLSRSSPMLLTLIMPAFMLLVFRLGPLHSGRSGGFLARAPNLAFPVGAGYAVLMLTNLVYNNLGAEGGGIQLLFAAPIGFKQVVLAKNLAHGAVLGVLTVLVWFAVRVLYGRPTLAVTLATIAGVLFAAPVNFAAGNLLSIYSPKKVDYGTFGRQRASRTTVLASFGVQLGIIAVGAIAVVAARHYGGLWLATLLLLALAALATGGYTLILGHLERMALERREILTSELYRA